MARFVVRETDGFSIRERGPVRKSSTAQPMLSVSVLDSAYCYAEVARFNQEYLPYNLFRGAARREELRAVGLVFLPNDWRRSTDGEDVGVAGSAVDADRFGVAVGELFGGGRLFVGGVRRPGAWLHADGVGGGLESRHPRPAGTMRVFHPQPRSYNR